MTNEVDGSSGRPLDAALSLVREGLAALGDLGLWQLSDADLRVLAAGLDRAGLLASAQLVRLLGEVDARGLPGQDGTASTGGWLRSVVPAMRPAEAAALGQRAERLYRSALAVELTATREAVLAGQVRPEQERLISTTIAALSPPAVPAEGPEAVDEQDVAAAQATLVGEAARFPVSDLAKLATAIRHHLDPGADDRLARDEAAQQRGRCLTLSTEPTGMVFVQGLLTKECGAALRTAIDAWSAPTPAADSPDGPPDPRTPAQRRHDALHRLAETTLAQGHVPTSHGSPAKVIVRVTAQTLAAALAPTDPSGVGGVSGGSGSSGSEGARQPTSSEPWRAVGRGRGPSRAPRAPSPPGQPAELADGTPISRQTLARIVCEADLVPVLVDDLGTPLDVGRTHRLFTTRQRTALVERDRGCTWPACTAPAEWCQAHHLTPWQAGGRSDLDNAALLCGRHHRHAHTTTATGKVLGGHVTWDEHGTSPPADHAPRRSHHLIQRLVRQWRTPRRQ